MIVVGIDPGQKTGIGVLEDGKLVDTVTLLVEEAVEWLMVFVLTHLQMDVTFVVECSYLLKARFRARADRSGWGIRKADQNAMRIVSSLRQTERLRGYIEKAVLTNLETVGKMEVVEIEPPQHGNRISKVRPALFRAMFPEYGGRTSEHSRDACTLAAWWIKQQKMKGMINWGS